MEIDLTKLSKPLQINQDINIDLKEYSNKDIQDLKNVHVSGTIYFNSADLLNIDLLLTGEMILKDSVTLEDIVYPFHTEIQEEYDTNEPYFVEYYKKSQNILDILAILWENIVLEVPIRLTNAKDTDLSGEGWSMGNYKKEKDNIDPRLAELAKLLDERKE